MIHNTLAERFVRPLAGERKNSLLRQRQDGGYRLRVSHIDLDLTFDEGIRDKVLPKSVPDDRDRIRQSDQSAPYEHGTGG